MSILIGENGFGYPDALEPNETIQDGYRIDYHRQQHRGHGRAAAEGCNVVSYLTWSGIDVISASINEMTKRYGFVYVDLDDTGNGSGRRIPKDSYDWYRTVVASNGARL